MPAKATPESVAEELNKRIESSKMIIEPLTDSTKFVQWHETLESVVNSCLQHVDDDERERYMAALEIGSSADASAVPASCKGAGPLEILPSPAS